MRGRPRAARRHRREVHRRRGHGGVRHPASCTRTMRCVRFGRPPGCARRSTAQRGARRDWGVGSRSARRQHREVVAGEPSGGTLFVTGDAVNVAQRLEQAADAGRDPARGGTYRLVADAVVAEPLGRSRQGKAQPAGWRLLEVCPGRRLARAPARLAARRPERSSSARRDVRARRRGAIVPPLHGARRRRASASPARARVRRAARRPGDVLRGRCLPYGEGITFWPLARGREAGGRITDRDSRTRRGEDPGAAAPRRGRTGSSRSASRPRVGLGRRRRKAGARASGPSAELFESLARERPIVVVVWTTSSGRSATSST